jgi:hypothetical protein
MQLELDAVVVGEGCSRAPTCGRDARGGFARDPGTAERRREARRPDVRRRERRVGKLGRRLLERVVIRERICHVADRVERGLLVREHDPVAVRRVLQRLVGRVEELHELGLVVRLGEADGEVALDIEGCEVDLGPGGLTQRGNVDAAVRNRLPNRAEQPLPDRKLLQDGVGALDLVGGEVRVERDEDRRARRHEVRRRGSAGRRAAAAASASAAAAAHHGERDRNQRHGCRQPFHEPLTVASNRVLL